MYYRYVDDIFCLFKCVKDADLFLAQLNSMHPSLKFTVERESNYFRFLMYLCIKLLQPFSPLYTESPPFLAYKQDGIHFAYSSAKLIWLRLLSIVPLWFHPSFFLVMKSSSSSQPCLRIGIHYPFWMVLSIMLWLSLIGLAAALLIGVLFICACCT